MRNYSRWGCGLCGNTGVAATDSAGLQCVDATINDLKIKNNRELQILLAISIFRIFRILHLFL